MPLAVCRVAVVTYPFDDIVGRATLDNLIQLLRPSAEVGPIITGAYRSTVASETVEVISSSPPASSPFRLLASKALESAQITAKVAGLSRQTNVVIFFLGARVHPFAVFAARLKGMKTIVVSTGSSSRTILKLYGARFNTHWGQLLSRLAGVLERLSFLTASVIGVESRTVTKFLGLENLESRVAVVGAIFVDERIFSPEKRPSQRPLRFGYIGRLSPEKGVLNFADALDLILPGLPEYRVTIGGAGPLEAQIRRQLKPHGNRIDALGWIDHTTVARRLPELAVLLKGNIRSMRCPQSGKNCFGDCYDKWTTRAGQPREWSRPPRVLSRESCVFRVSSYHATDNFHGSEKRTDFGAECRKNEPRDLGVLQIPATGHVAHHKTQNLHRSVGFFCRG